MKRLLLCVHASCVIAGYGCGSSLELTRWAAAARPSGNVTVFFTVDDAAGRPVTDLRPQDLALYEDGKQLSATESRQTMVPPSQLAAHDVLLVLDMSTSARASDQQAAITLAVRDFVARVGAKQRVAVYAFDGGRSVYELLPFGSAGDAAARVVERLHAFEMRDPSTNLHGAVLQTLGLLDASLRASRSVLRFGTLVVFTEGTDRGNRVPYQQVIDAVEASPDKVYTLGMGREVDDSALARIGKTGYLRVEDSVTLAVAFRELADQLTADVGRQYVVSYCSAAGAGEHALTLEARRHGSAGQLSYEFQNESGGAAPAPACDAESPQAFDANDRSSRL